jgi:hypothetical protein
MLRDIDFFRSSLVLREEIVYWTELGLENIHTYFYAMKRTSLYLFLTDPMIRNTYFFVSSEWDQ